MHCSSSLSGGPLGFCTCEPLLSEISASLTSATPSRRPWVSFANPAHKSCKWKKTQSKPEVGPRALWTYLKRGGPHSSKLKHMRTEYKWYRIQQQQHAYWTSTKCKYRSILLIKVNLLDWHITSASGTHYPKQGATTYSRHWLKSYWLLKNIKNQHFCQFGTTELLVGRFAWPTK